MDKLLAGDIGGTNCRLALCDYSSGKIEVCETEVFPSKEFNSFEDILKEFLKGKTRNIVASCFGVPGPVIKGEVRVTNLPWTIASSSLAELLQCNKVRLLNDLVATISGVRELSESQRTLVYPGSSSSLIDNIAIVAPGTGLGQAAMIDGFIIPSEGGHVEFSSRNEREFKLQEFIKSYRKCSRVSMERVISGPGLENIFNFLIEVEGYRPTPEAINRIEHKDDLGAVIGELGLQGEDQLCAETLRLFVNFLAVHCSNVILTYISTGGLYLGGGISAKLFPLLASDHFLAIMHDKGRMSPLIKSTPIYVITERFSGLFGALHVAKLMAKGN
jgi:glucokinase